VAADRGFESVQPASDRRRGTHFTVPGAGS
jgi:hypothetical protein